MPVTETLVPWDRGFIPGSYNPRDLCKVAVADGALQSRASVAPDETRSLSHIRKGFGHPAWNQAVKTHPSQLARERR